MKVKIAGVCLLSLLIANMVVSQTASAQSNMTDLGTLGGALSYATGVNNLGQVVGYSLTASNDYHAFLWNKENKMKDLGTLGGPNSSALGVNDLGQVVGYSFTSSLIQRAFLWTKEEGMIDLGTLGGSWSVATDINNRGQVIGYSETAFPESVAHTFLWTSDGSMEDLTVLVGYPISAADINNLGQVAGSFTDHSNRQRSFLWTREEGLKDLSSLAGYSISAINDLGSVVGASTYGFLWSEEEGMVNIGALWGGTWSGANDINALGQVVGTSHNPSPKGPRAAFMWTAEYGITGLGGSDSRATSINNWGQAVGSSLGWGRAHAVLWTVLPLTAQIISDNVKVLILTEKLNKGQGNSLMAKLEAASHQQAGGKIDAAGSMLEAFINEVEAYLSSGILLPADGQPLINAAGDVISQFND